MTTETNQARSNSGIHNSTRQNHEPSPKRLGLRQQPIDEGFMKVSFIPGEARLVFLKIAGLGKTDSCKNARLKRQLAEQAKENCP